MAVGWSHGHDVIKRKPGIGGKSGAKSARMATRSGWATSLAEVTIALAVGLAITWFLATVALG